MCNTARPTHARIDMRPSLRFALPCLVLLAGSVGSSTPASAVVYRNSSAGAVCHPANGALVAKFNRTLNFIQNAGTTDAYVICQQVMDDADVQPYAVTLLTASVALPNTGTTATCTAQVGAHYDNTNFVYMSFAKSFTATEPNDSTHLEWDVPFYRIAVFHVLTINCKLPPGAKLGLLQRWEEPVGS
jgi:hypothetical protein